MECIGNEAVMAYTKPFCFTEGVTREQVGEKAIEGLSKLGELLKDGRQFLTGAKPVIADFILFEHINFALHVTGGKTWDAHAHLQAFHERMWSLGGIKQYMEGPQFASVKDTYIPYPPAKVDVNSPL